MDSSRRGLSATQAAAKLSEWGPNEIRDTRSTFPLLLILRQLRKNHILYLLLAASAISFLVHEPITGYVILLVIAIIVTVTFIQEYKAEQAIAALKQMVMPVSIVIRDGVEQDLPSSQIVPDDLVVLRSGDRVPADAKVLEQYELRTDEAILTGESREKSKRAVTTAPLTDDHLVFMGSFVVSGRAVVQVLHTGMNTKFGKISGMISESVKELPLQDKVNRIARFMVYVALAVSVVTGILMFLQSPQLDSVSVTHILVLMIALSVSAFPEGLPVVMMTALAVGATRMARKNAIVNRMSIIETLGETTVICTDKTGTLTTGEMTVRKIITDGQTIDVTGVGFVGRGDFLQAGQPFDPASSAQLSRLFQAAVLCNNATITRTGEDHHYKVIGTPTEGSLLIFAAKAGIYREDQRFTRVSEVPFSSERKTMAVAGKLPQGDFIFIKGAPEVLIQNCAYIQKASRVIKLTSAQKSQLTQHTASLTAAAYRTLAFAYLGPQHRQPVFLGIVGMEDPPRREVAESLRLCAVAGITVKMITGDNPQTAAAIASQIGLSGSALTGPDLDQASDSELRQLVKTTTIFSRVRPEHKLRIVKALKENGDVVTMTGDGVNDAPALKEANIGVAMGKNGTDVSRSVADLTLKDDNFATIVEAIKEGRTIFNNIRKFVTYQLSCNYAELAILLIGVILSPVLGWQIPLLLSLQILFMNLVTDDFPAITLSLNRTSTDVMSEPPRRHTAILTRPLYLLLFGTGLFMAFLTLISFYLSYNQFGLDLTTSRTAALVTLILLEIFNAFNFRSFRFSVLSRSPFINKYLFLASLLSLAATLLIIYTPLNQIFSTAPIGWLSWAISLALALFFTAIYDVLKRTNAQRHLLHLT